MPVGSGSCCCGSAGGCPCLDCTIPESYFITFTGVSCPTCTSVLNMSYGPLPYGPIVCKTCGDQQDSGGHSTDPRCDTGVEAEGILDAADCGDGGTFNNVFVRLRCDYLTDPVSPSLLFRYLSRTAFINIHDIRFRVDSFVMQCTPFLLTFTGTWFQFPSTDLCSGTVVLSG